MILSKKYNEIMDHVRLSDAARTRILEQVEKAEVRHSTFQWTQWGAIAACLAIALIGIFAWTAQNKPVPDKGPVLTGPVSPEETASLDELSEAVGFPVEDVASICSADAEVQYTNLFDEMAEITVQDGGQKIVFRKAQGSDDISGDYNAYDVTQETTLAGVPCTLKGDGATVTLILWEKDGCSYALRLEPALAEAEASALCTQILNLQ